MNMCLAPELSNFPRFAHFPSLILQHHFVNDSFRIFILEQCFHSQRAKFP